MAKILIVEDYLTIRDLYRRFLEKEDHQVDLASNGEEGLAKILVGGYDLILLNLVLPKFSAVDILKKIQKVPPKKPNGKIVVLSTIGEDKLVQEAQNLGAAGNIVKSTLTPEKIVEGIKQFLN